MHNPTVSQIAAIGRNRELGRDNKLLWNIPEDAKYFRDTVKNHVTIMGRKTFESLVDYLKKPLPCKMNIVITRDKLYRYDHDKVMITHSLDEALTKAKILERDEVFVIGGAQIYNLALPKSDRLYLTLVDKSFPEADTYFPQYREFSHMVSKKEQDNGKYTFSYCIFERESTPST